MRIRLLTVPASVALVIACAPAPGTPTAAQSTAAVTVTLPASATPTSATPTPSVQASSATPTTAPTSATASAPKPDPKASQQIPDVGTMPSGFTLPRTDYQLNGIAAFTFCSRTWYPALAQRLASRFRSSASETFESGGDDGVAIMTTEAAAKQLMAELRAAAAACRQPSQTHAAKSLTIPAGSWEESVGLAHEKRDQGKPTVESFGTAVYIVRKGRVVVGTTDWTMYAQPVAGEGFDRAPALTRLAAMLKVAKA